MRISHKIGSVDDYELFNPDLEPGVVHYVFLEYGTNHPGTPTYFSIFFDGEPRVSKDIEIIQEKGMQIYIDTTIVDIYDFEYAVY